MKRWISFILALGLLGALGAAPSLYAKKTKELKVHILRSPMADRAYLGVQLQEVTPEDVKELRLPEERGARIMRVEPGSPAEQAGIREDDVIVRWNETTVESARQLVRMVSETPAGRTVRLGIIRGGKPMTLKVKLGRKRMHPTLVMKTHPMMDEAEALDEEIEALQEEQEQWAEEARIKEMELQEALKELKHQRELMESLERRFGDRLLMMEMRSTSRRWGFTVEELTRQLADYFGLKGRTGLLVTEVRKGSPAETAGLHAGDVIVGADSRKVESADDLFEVLEKRESGVVNLRVMRNRKEITLKMNREEVPSEPA